MNLRGLVTATHEQNDMGSLGQPETQSQEDLSSVERILLSGMQSSSLTTQELSKRLVKSGGKRVRPLLLCLTYRSLCSPEFKPRGSETDIHYLAAVAEWVHTATLFHDDVLDNSPLRRGQTAAHISHGNKRAILVGDFVYAEAFHLLMSRGLLEPSKELADTIKRIVEGEILQHELALSRSLDKTDYDTIAKAKTGTLFSWCMGTGAWCAGLPNFSAARELGEALGFAFQMADDLFDTFAELKTDGEVEEWVTSAAPLPLAVRQELCGDIASEWKALVELPMIDQRKSIANIVAKCRDPRVVAICKERIQSSLNSASRLLEELGSKTSLRNALMIIEARCYEAFEITSAKA